MFETETALTLRSPPRTPRITPHWYRLLMINDITEIGERALELPAIDSLSRFTGVFEGDAEVGTAGTGGLGGLDRSRCVADLVGEEMLAEIEEGGGGGA